MALCINQKIVSHQRGHHGSARKHVITQQAVPLGRLQLWQWNPSEVGSQECLHACLVSCLNVSSLDDSTATSELKACSCWPTLVENILNCIHVTVWGHAQQQQTHVSKLLGIKGGPQYLELHRPHLKVSIGFWRVWILYPFPNALSG